MKTVLIVVLAATAACGGSKPASTSPSQAGDPAAGDHTGKGHGAAMPQIETFHDTLAPRWHAPQGPQRMADTCAAQAQFRDQASAIAAAHPPSGGDAAAWAAHGKQLTDAVAALEATCKANDAVAFEPAFERVHSTFHGVMEASGGQHGKHEHGKHEQGKHEQGKEHSEHKP